MSIIEKTIDVDVPLRVAYDQWTQFEDFPRFMEGVESVRQVDDRHLHWTAKIGGKRVEWDAEIVEQVPDRVIAWRSTSGAKNSGSISFQAMDPFRTRVTLHVEIEPHGLAESLGDAAGVVSRRVVTALEKYKDFVENRRTPTGSWRGEIHGTDVIAPGESHPAPPP